MANKIKVDVEVTSNIDEQTRSAKVLRKELESAKRISGDSGRAASDTKAFAAAAEAAASSTERLGYGIARAAVGTGAAGRDFAKQAQGLGGLVHVYATFAANLFAVGAAFTALKNAADTTNMIKGLDQLGAASGRGLGSLAKEIVKLTDGAVTLREAMEATAKSTAAGMSSEDLRRLATGAKNASQALGVDMSDALSRLSRGITKLEPELLDELGIFVRVDKAASDYAKTLAKPASALTDFEKRAGFAAAVLTQVEEKFGSIKIDSNPYNQLLASLKEVLQTGLEVVNTVLTPVLRLLASSPTGLAAAISVIGAVLLKQAIPALGSFKESMKEASDQAAKIANIKTLEATAARRAVLTEKELLLENKIEDQIGNVLAAQKKLDNYRESSLNKNTSAYKLLKKAEEDVINIREEDYAAVEKAAKRAEARGQVDQAAIYREVSTAVRANVQAENDLADAREKNAASLLNQAKWYSTLGQIQRSTDRANLDAIQRQIISTASYTASIKGPIAAFKELGSSIAKAMSGPQLKEFQVPVLDFKGKQVLDEFGNAVTKTESITISSMGKIRGAFTLLKGSIGIATTAVGTFMNAFGTWAQFIGLAIAGFSILIDKFSSTKNESKATAEAFDQLTASGENTFRVLERLSTIDPLERLNVQNIQARATALSELSSTASKAFSSVTAEMTKMGRIDKAVDWVKGIFGADIGDNLAEGLSTAISDSFELATKGSASDSARAAIENLLGVKIDPKNKDAIKTVLESLIKGGPAAKAKVKDIVTEVENLSKAESITAARGTELIDSIKTTDKAFQDLFTSLIPQDAMSKLGQQVIQESFKMSLAAEEPIQKLNIVKALLENPSQQALLGEETRKIFIENATALSGVIDEVGKYDRAIEDAETSIKKLEKVQEDIYDSTASGILDYKGIAQTKAQINSLKDTIKDLENQRIKTIEQLEGKGIDVSTLGDKLFTKGAELFASSIVSEAAKGATVMAKAIASTIADTRVGVATNVAMENAQLESEKRLIQSQALLAQAMYENTAAQQMKTALDEKARLEAKTTKSSKDMEDLANYTKQIVRLENASKAYQSTVKTVDVTKPSTASKADTTETLQYLNKQNVTQELITLQMQLQGAQIQINNKGAQQAANTYLALYKQKQIDLAEELKAKDNIKETNSLILQRVSAISTINGVIAPQLLNYKQQLELQNLQIENDKKIKQASFDLTQYQAAALALGKASGSEYEKDLKTKREALNIAEKTKSESEATLKISQTLASNTNEINIRRELLSLEQQRIEALSAIGVIASEEAIRQQGAEQLQLLLIEHATRRASIEQQIANARKAGETEVVTALTSQLAFEEQINEKKRQNLELTTQIKAEQAATVKISESFNIVFDQLNNAAGSFATALLNAQSVAKAYGKQLNDNKEAQKKQEAIISDSNSSLDEIVAAEEERKKLKKDETKLTKESQTAQLKADAAILGSAKKLFNEKSVGYKVLSGIEKAMHVASLAMEAERIATEVAGLATRIPTYIADIFGKVNSVLPPPAGAIVAAGLIATLVALAASAGASTGGVSMPAPPSYEDLQKVQGTGQDYVAGTTGTATTALTSNNGGVLGDIAAKSEDIANSIDYMESNSFETLIYNNKMLMALKDIENNTKEFVSALARAGFTGENSPFGTLATYSANAGTNVGIGPLSLFSGGGSSTATSIEDWGIEANATLSSLLSGAAKVMGYELEKIVRTWSGSSVFGMQISSGGSSTEYRPHARELSTAMTDTFKVILYDIKETVLAYGSKLTTTTVEDLNNIVNSALIDFKISTKGLTADEIYDAVVAELGTTANAIVAEAYPFLTNLQQFGEGLLTTLTRVTTNMETVNIMFKQMGKDIESNIDSYISSISKTVKALDVTATEKAGSLQFVDKAAATFKEEIITFWEKVANEWETVQLDPGTIVKYGAGDSFVESVVDASGIQRFANDVFGDPLKDVFKAGYKLVEQKVITEVTTPVEAKISIYEDLIDRFGGDLEVFVEKTQFYVDNFVDANTVLMAHYDSVDTELARLQALNPNIQISTVDTRAEFAALVDSLDLTSESGRLLYADLMNLAPGFDVINQHIADLISNAGMAADDFAKILMDAITGNTTIAEAGTKVAESIKAGILDAVASSYVTSISTAFNDLIITPIVSAVTTGATLTNIISTQAITEIRNIALGAANAIAIIFKDPAFVTAIKEATTLIGDTIKQMAAVTQITTGSISKIIAKYNTKLIDAYKKQASEIQSTLNKFKGFSDSLKEFRDSLLTGALSPKTPLEKYNLALQDLDQTYALAMKGDETAIARLKTVAQTFLDMSREYYASSDAYVSDFDRVQRILDSTIGLVDTQVSDLERQLQVAQDQLAVLGYIDETTKTIAELLAEANAGQKEEVGNVLSSGFTVLDKNFDGLLTLDELKTSGIASDSELQKIYSTIDANGDGQISMLEALKASTEGTTFGVNSLAPILEGIKNGTLSVKDAIDYLAQLNIANVGVGGTPITSTELDTAAKEQTRLEWVQAYVQGAYRDILNREAESGGLQYWTNQIISGKLAITDLYATISQSDEAINRSLQERVTNLDGYITNAYTMLLDRAPDIEGFNFWKSAIETNAISIADLYKTFTQSAEYLNLVRNTVNEFNSIMGSVTVSGSIPGFASGGYHSGGLRIVGENGPELEATGEARLWNAVQTQQMISGAASRNSSNSDLIAEIQRLNAKLESLEQTVQQGDIMNAQATERNTQQVSATVKETGSTTTYANKLQARAVIV